MALKPRIVLATLVVASLLGVSLTWTGTDASPVAPVASWVAIASLGTLLTNGPLWLRYARESEPRPEGLVRRWSRVGYVAGTAAVAGLVVRLATVGGGVAPPVSLVIGGLAGTVALGATTALNRWSIPSKAARSLALTVAVFAGLGLVAIAWLDVGVDGGSVGAVAVRAFHLVAVGAWIGGAVWHNAVVVPALRADGETGIEPVVRRFRRAVPLFVVVVLLTGAHQATTWLGTHLATYLTTTVGLFVALKLVALSLLAVLVVRGRRRSRPPRGSDH